MFDGLKHHVGPFVVFHVGPMFGPSGALAGVLLGALLTYFKVLLPLRTIWKSEL